MKQGYICKAFGEMPDAQEINKCFYDNDGGDNDDDN